MKIWVLCALLFVSSCSKSPNREEVLTVAAAANLTDVFDQIGTAYKSRTGERVVFSYASTAQLAQQIENGAPFDVFAGADTEHIDALIAKGKLDPASRAVYALGQLALWVPATDGAGLKDVKILIEPKIHFIAVAQPELAPYGRAAVETLKNAGLWEAVRPKVVYASNINQAKQLAASGNADAAFVAYSLVLHAPGSVTRVDPNLYAPIEQAIAIVSSSPRTGSAQRFRNFVLSDQGQAILSMNGYARQPPGR